MSKKGIKRLIAFLIIFLVCGILPLFSQEILATIESGYSFSSGFKLGFNLLFIGNSGFAISAGFDLPDLFNAGLGYVYYNSFYIGGILKFISDDYYWYDYFFREVAVLFAPTFIVGYDFGVMTLGTQLSYLFWTGFKATLSLGLNLNSFSGNKINTKNNSNNDEWW